MLKSTQRLDWTFGNCREDSPPPLLGSVASLTPSCLQWGIGFWFARFADAVRTQTRFSPDGTAASRKPSCSYTVSIPAFPYTRNCLAIHADTVHQTANVSDKLLSLILIYEFPIVNILACK